MSRGGIMRCDACQAAIGPGEPIGRSRSCVGERDFLVGKVLIWQFRTLCTKCTLAQATRPFLPRKFDDGQGCRHCDRLVHHAHLLKRKAPFCSRHCRVRFWLGGWVIRLFTAGPKPDPQANRPDDPPDFERSLPEAEA
jgi:hypothetical protein